MRYWSRFLIVLVVCGLCGVSMMAQDSDAGYAEALRRIEEARNTKSYHLDLSALGLQELPPELWQITWLGTLRLSHNKLTTLPPEIQQLSNLTWLQLDNNPLTTLPAELGEFQRMPYLILENTFLPVPPPDVQAQGISAIVSYIRHEVEIRPLYQFIHITGATLGGFITLILAFRTRQRRAVSEKKKRM